MPQSNDNRGTLSRWVQAVLQSRFVRNAAVLVSGTAVAQATTLAASPILTRLYAPESFGLLGLFTAATTVVGVVSAWKYELAIVLPKTDEDAVRVFLLSSLIVGGMTAATWIGVTVAADDIAQLMGSAALGQYLVWLPVSVFMVGMYHVLNYWATRRTYYTQLSVSQGIRSAGIVGTQGVAGGVGAGAGGLVAGRVAGECIASLSLFWQIWRKDGALIRRGLQNLALSGVAKVYRKFPTYSAPQTLLNAVSQNIPAFLFGYYFSAEIVGLYWFTYRLLQAPSGLISEAVRKVFYQQASEAYNAGEHAYPLLSRVTGGLFLLAGLPVVLVFAFGPELFAFVFGDEWLRAGEFGRWLALWTLFGFANAPSVMLINIYNKQKYLLMFEIVLAAGRLVSIPIGAKIGDEITAIMIFSSVGMVLNGALILFVYLYSRRSYQQTETR
jgi:O-antigen/teichoic acid export membrane protein